MFSFFSLTGGEGSLLRLYRVFKEKIRAWGISFGVS